MQSASAKASASFRCRCPRTTILSNFHDGNARPDLHNRRVATFRRTAFTFSPTEVITLMTTAESTLHDQSPDGKSSLPLSDLISGTVVFLVALPLCLGIALASGTQVPLFAGLIAGIVGGIVVGTLSGSQTSVSGPAAGLTAVVAAQIAELGSFEAFLLAVVVGGLLQLGLGLLKAGSLSAFFPSSVIKGLLAAIGVILILKQIPHVLGHDSDPEGEMSYSQPDDETTFSELGTVLQGDIHAGAVVVGLLSIALLVLWGRWKPLKNSIVPAPLVVVLLGVGLNLLFQKLGGRWLIGPSHLVEIPVGDSAQDVLSFLTFPDFHQWANPRIYFAGVTIAIVASLETLLNLQAVDKLDPQQRVSPPSRELLAGLRQHRLRNARRAAGDFCDCARVGQCRSRRQDKTVGHISRNTFGLLCCSDASVSEHDSAGRAGCDFAGDRIQTGQPGFV